MIERIALLGTGLIGGSLGRAWRRYAPELHVTGFDEPEVLDEAQGLEAIDAKAATPHDAVRDADLVVLAAPLAASLRLLTTVAPHLKPGARVTDVGSVKVPIRDHAAKVLGDANPFIGGHPMAGKEHRGVAHADLFLFENATYVLCPARGMTHRTVQDDHDDLIQLVRATGARVLLLDAERHDRIAALVSHLPQLLAVALARQASDQHADDDAVLRLAAGGFRDMTRIASSPFEMWREILVANEGPILDALAGFAHELQQTRNRLIEEDLDALGARFAQARQAREGIPRDTKGFLHPLSDVYVGAEDRPGELKRIIDTLMATDLNIKDIELLKIREGTGGTFRLGFASETDAEAAREALNEAGFTARRP